MSEVKLYHMDPSHSTAYMLEHYQFLYSIPTANFYDKEFHDKVGMILSGDKELDKTLATAPMHTGSNILVMAQRHYDDVPMRLQNPAHSLAIYTICKRALDEWLKAIRTDLNVVDAPTLELRILDEFADTMFDTAKYYQPKLEPTRSLADRLRSMRTSIPQFERNPDRVSKRQEEERKPRVYNPIIDAIEQGVEHRMAPPPRRY